MSDFKSAYKMLRHLKRMGITKEKWEQILISLQKGGYIDGITTIKTLTDGKERIAKIENPSKVLKGLESLGEDSLSKISFDALKTISKSVK